MSMPTIESRAVTWTAADQAELDVIAHALVVGYFVHRRRCRSCAASRQPGGLPCPHLQAAIGAVGDWREARILLSRAEALRAAEQEAAA